MVLDRALAALLYVIPAYVSNAAPVVFGGGKDYIDGGFNLGDGRRFLGDGKTWAGLFAGLVMGTIATVALALLVPRELAFGLAGRERVVLGILLTLGAQAGDLLGSFVKRRLGIARGDRALLLDQLLFLALALALAALHFLPPWEEIAFLAVLTLVLHPASNYVAYLFHLKRVPW